MPLTEENVVVMDANKPKVAQWRVVSEKRSPSPQTGEKEMGQHLVQKKITFDQVSEQTGTTTS